jgi:hypothetical protein
MQKKLQQLLIIFQHFHSQNQRFHTFRSKIATTGRNNIPTMLNSFLTLALILSSLSKDWFQDPIIVCLNDLARHATNNR